jgi:hypothetical protein
MKFFVRMSLLKPLVDDGSEAYKLVTSLKIGVLDRLIPRVLADRLIALDDTLIKIVEEENNL